MSTTLRFTALALLLLLPPFAHAQAPSDAVPPPPANARTCAAQAARAAADSVVRIRSGGKWGAGFVYHSPRHVITAFSLISLGQPVTVVARNGAHLPALLRAKDESYDLAILEVSESVPGARPLEPAPRSSAVVGASVVAIGHPFAGLAGFLGPRGRGLLRWSVSQGVIGAVNENGIQADVALNEGHTGGPLVDCDGKVLGMITGAGMLSSDLGLVGRISRADALFAQGGRAGEFLGDLRLRLGIGFLLRIDEQARTAVGGYVTLGATLFDRISWMNRVGLLFGGLDNLGTDELSAERLALRVETMLGYRFFLDIGGFTTLYIVPSLGVAIDYQREAHRRVTVVPVADPACVPSAAMSCVMPQIDEAVSERWTARPAAGITFLFGDMIELGYTLEVHIDPEPVTTYHALHLGVLF